jgi:hypothetical protein
MMGYYVLQPDDGDLFGTRWAYADQVDPVLRARGNRCPVCGDPVGGRRWLPPHRIKLSSAKPEKWGDLLWGAGFRLMVSARFKRVYQSEGLTGIAFHPPAEIVRVGRRKTGDIPADLPAYHLVEVMWNGANLDDVASGTVRKKKRRKCEFCRGAALSFDQVALDESSWTGADVFEARGLYGEIVVTQRFKLMVEKHEMKNAWLIPAKRYAYDEHRPGLWYVREE